MSRMSPIFIIIIIIGGLIGYFSYNRSYKIASTNQSRNNYYYDKEDNDYEPTPEPTKTSEYENIREITMSDLRTMAQGNSKYILVLTGSSCTYCRNYKPVLDVILDENNLTAYELEVWSLSSQEHLELNELTGTFEGVPTTVILQGSTKIDSVTGGIQREDIIKFLERNGLI